MDTMNQRHSLPVEGEIATPPLAPTSAPAPIATKPPLAEPLTLEQIETLKNRIVEELHKCFDPEIPVNIYELGLIYDITTAPVGAIVMS
jgi:hypothetical protein